MTIDRSAEKHPTVEHHRNRTKSYMFIAEALRKFHDRFANDCNLRMPSTSRTREMYRCALFPDCTTEDQMEQVLNEGDVLDAGSGMTYKNPYALIHYPRTHGKMVAMDQRNPAVVGGMDEFTTGDNIKNQLMITYMDLKQLCKLRSPKRSLSKTNAAERADLRNIPHGDSSFRQILSLFCYPYWIDDEGDREAIFSEFDRVLAPSGQMRFCSSMHRTERTLFDSAAIAERIQSQYQVSLYDPKGWGGLRDAMGNATIVLTKKA